ncbi:uncharacterized protein B0H64DRAFT_358755 [Chaetomium fimeti]|uniref:Uncharacterized protein n=1 Tax=Chaetomium fimeti TaxID=1854472 RepID=A0AAE0HF22_9PEZI|nr:hypothetical protein B0H64DRAFT_358755 [Chaetomium fimeti]
MPWSDTSYTYYSGPSEVLTDDMRKCQVEGCNKMHAFSRPDGGAKVYSRYCSNHTCDRTYPGKKEYHCTHPRSSKERYCSTHLTCGESGCTKLGEHSGTHDYVRWFCSSHRCTSPDCRLRAIDRTQQRCVSHLILCTIPTCTRPAHQHRDGRLDAVCAAHYGTQRCEWAAGCTRRASASRSSSSSSSTPQPQYCTSHHQCRTPLCERPRDISRGPRKRDSSGGEVLDHCALHTCRTAGCRSEVHTLVDYCGRHACAGAGCARPRLSADPASTLSVGLDRDLCAVHAAAGQRRAVSMDGVEIGLDWEGLRGRFEMGEEGRRERERNRLSDDLERMRRRERELEADLGLGSGSGRADRRRGMDREAMERMQRDFQAWNGVSSEWERRL